MKRIRKLIVFFPAIIIPIIAANPPSEFEKKFFTQIYQQNVWGSDETHSGGGSTLKQTQNIREFLPELFKELNVKTFIDAPCGDFNWMKEVNMSYLKQYIGLDIVDELIIGNTIRYASPKHTFNVCNIIKDTVPYADLILCRDCLQHLNNDMIFKVINNFKKSKSRYLLVSNFPHVTKNIDIEKMDYLGRCRPLNLELPPFNFPSPMLRFKEGFSNKELALWKLEDLPE